jgi:hypothetical protein
MTATVIIFLCLLLVGLGLGVRARSAIRNGDYVRALVRFLAGIIFLLLALLLATITVGTQGYRALTNEDVAATVKTEPLGPQRFRATITLPDKRLAMYELQGDAFYVDAHILKWKPWANLLGLHTAYELDRVAGRYNAVADEQSRPHSVYSLATNKPLDVFFLARRTLLGAMVDAEYGSAAFIAGNQPAEYQVRVSTTGLLIRPVLHSTIP